MRLLKSILLKCFSTGVEPFVDLGNEADAIILECSHTGITRNQLREMRIVLQVMPKNGRNFVAEFRPIINSNQESFLHSGYKMKVTIDPRHPQRILPPDFDYIT